MASVSDKQRAARRRNFAKARTAARQHGNVRSMASDFAATDLDESGGAT